MLRGAVQACPETFWTDPAFENQFWRIAFHTLFYVHFYLKPEADFVPWAKEIPNANFMGPSPLLPDGLWIIEGYNTREEILEYIDMIEAMLPDALAAYPLEGPSGFDWISFSRLELHIYNIRHVQHHAGQLIERLRANGYGGVDWVGKVREETVQE